jgi:hypothetical protein
MPTLEEQGVRAIGIAWMREEDYPALIRIFEDGDVFDSWNNGTSAPKPWKRSFKATASSCFAHTSTRPHSPHGAPRGTSPPAAKPGPNSASSLPKNDTGATRVKILSSCRAVLLYREGHMEGLSKCD